MNDMNIIEVKNLKKYFPVGKNSFTPWTGFHSP